MFKLLLNISGEHGNSELNRIEYLDGWRGIAILFVLISHFLSLKAFDFGRMGVDIFFVLSGMLMANILFIKRVSLKTFYKRRISRIAPIFIIYVCSVYLVSYLANLSEEHGNLFYTLSFLRTYLPTTPDIWNTGIPTGHLWSLNIEEHCYIFLSLLTLFAFIRKKEGILLIMLGITAIAIHYLYIKIPKHSISNFQLRTEVAASHILLSAGYFLVKDNIKHLIPKWLPILTFLAAIFCYHQKAPWFTSWLFTPFLFAFTVNHLDLIPDSIKKALSFTPLRLFGLWSFSIYLWQQPFYHYLTKGNSGSIWFGILSLLLSIAAGMLSFFLIENPVRKYLNNNW